MTAPTMGRTSHATAADHADASDITADREVPGRSSRTQHLSPVQRQTEGAGLPFLDVLLASSPAASTPAPVQRKENEFASFNNVSKDPATGLEAHQERAVDRLVTSVYTAVATWEQQRGTPDLIFKGTNDVKHAFKAFRDIYIADENYELLLREAGRRMQDSKIPALAREVRMFNPTALIELKGLLGLEDAEPSHTYEFCPVWGADGGVSAWGVKAGAVTKTIKVRYTNTEIPELSWTQHVKLRGFQLGFAAGGKLKPEVSGSGPGDWETAEDSPRFKYLPPSFFQGAEFTNPSVSGSVSVGPASLKKGFGEALLVEKGGERLRWDMPMGTGILDDIEAEAGVDGEMLAEAAENNGVDYTPEVGAEAVNEFGSTELDGELEFNAGEWAEIENPEKQDNETWVPLHYARVFFDTGEVAMHDDDLATVQQVVNAIKKWDKRPGYEGSIFKVDISGCHSSKFEKYDDQLRALDERRDADGELHGKDLLREYDLLGQKDQENLELAEERARRTHMVFTHYLGQIASQMIYGVLGKSEVAEPTTHDPLGANPYADRDEDRSATILVSYKIFSKNRSVNWNAGDPI